MNKFPGFFFDGVNKVAEILMGLTFIMLCLSFAAQVPARYVFNYSLVVRLEKKVASSSHWGAGEGPTGCLPGR